MSKKKVSNILCILCRLCNHAAVSCNVIIYTSDQGGKWFPGFRRQLVCASYHRMLSYGGCALTQWMLVIGTKHNLMLVNIKLC